MTATNRDFIAQLDAAIGCQQCGGALGGSPSDDFCSDDCQAAWSAARTTPLKSYSEPDEQPAHVDNLIELHSPETCVACVEGRHRHQTIDSAMAAALAYGSSYVVTDEVAGFIVPSRNARREFLNDRIQVGPAENYERRGRAWMPVAPTATDLTLPPDQTWQDLGMAQEPVSFGFDPGTPESGGSLVAVTRRNGVDHMQVIVSPGYALLPPELVGRMRQVTSEVGQAYAAAWNDVAPAIEDAFRSMSTAVNHAYQALRPLAEALREMPPEDPRERALWLRQHRNTGPAVSARAPRAINPRGRR